MAPAPERPGGVAVPDGPRVRVGRIEFVNCFPLYHHFERELASRGVRAEIVGGYPAALNEMLVKGEIDVALPSSIAFARDADQLVLLPQVSISSFGAVDSIQLFARTPPAHIRRVALTEKSATSICLLKVLCREWGIEPEFAPRRGPLSEVLEDFDALLLIGDEALHLLRVEAYPHHVDLGEEWKKVTGLPMVYAVCAARRDFAHARPEAAAAVGAALLASRDACAAAPRRRPPPPLRSSTSVRRTSWTTSTSSSSASRRTTARDCVSSTGAPPPSASWRASRILDESSGAAGGV